MEKFINSIISHLPKPIQTLWYKYESIWMYIIVGGLTTVVSLIFQMIPTAIFTSFNMATWLNTLLSTTISWIASVTFAFFTNKKYVFKSETHTASAFRKEFFMFYGARLVTYFLEILIMEVGNHVFATVNSELVTWRSLVVKIFAQVIILVVNYVFSKLVVFKKREEQTSSGK
jgi:putative flippase GtrA